MPNCGLSKMRSFLVAPAELRRTLIDQLTSYGVEPISLSIATVQRLENFVRPESCSARKGHHVASNQIRGAATESAAT